MARIKCGAGGGRHVDHVAFGLFAGKVLLHGDLSGHDKDAAKVHVDLKLRSLTVSEPAFEEEDCRDECTLPRLLHQDINQFVMHHSPPGVQRVLDFRLTAAAAFKRVMRTA